MSERETALKEALEQLELATAKTCCEVAASGDTRWHLVDTLHACMVARKLLASLPPGDAPQTCPHCKLPAEIPEVCTPELNAVIEAGIARDWDLLNRGVEIGQGFTAQPAPQTCEWREDEDGTWNTGCGRDWVFIEDGTPENCRVNFCVGCGKSVVPVVLVPAEEPTK